MENNIITPAKYRAWIEYCEAIGINPLPAHSVTPTGCWAMRTPVKPNRAGNIAIGRNVNGKRYDMQLHTLSLIHSLAPSVWRDIAAIQADDANRAVVYHLPICAGNNACFNPEHLRLGIQTDRDADRQRDAGYGRGESNGRARLDAAQVAAIRAEAADGAKQRALARKYGVSFSTINKIVNRKSWRFVR